MWMQACAPSSGCCPQSENCARRTFPGPVVDASVSLRSLPWCPMFIDRRAAALAAEKQAMKLSPQQQSIAAAIEPASERGITVAEIAQQTGIKPRVVSMQLHRLRKLPPEAQVMRCVRSHLMEFRYWPMSATQQHAERVTADIRAREVAEAKRRAMDEQNRRCREWRARRSEQRRQMRLQREAARQRYIEEQARIKAEKAARLAELSKAAKKVRKLDAEAKKETRHRPMIPLKRGEHALTNAYAAKIKGDGTRGPAPKEKPAPTVTWPAHITVQRATPVPDRWAPTSVAPVFSALPLGQYLSEAA